MSLGIDEYDTHLVKLNFRAGHYDEGSFSVVGEAIVALEVIHARLAVMQSTPGVRFSERNACNLGAQVRACSRRHDAAGRRLAQRNRTAPADKVPGRFCV